MKTPTALIQPSSRVLFDNPGVVIYTVNSLPVGTWFFAVTAFDTSGNESGLSNIASKTITE